MSVFKKIGNSLSEVKNNASAKINSTFGNGTSDSEFDTKKSEIIKQKKNFKRLQQSIAKFQAAAQDMRIAQEKITKNLSKILENDTSQILQLSTSFTSELEQNSKRLESSLKLDVSSMIDAYLVQYTEIERRMDERYTRLTSMDKAEKEMKNMETKSATVSGIRTEDYRNNYQTMKENYDSLNNELKNDITNLMNDRAPFVEVLYPCIADAQCKYFTGSHTSCNTISKTASQANPDRVRNYSHKITPNGSSVMYVHKSGRISPRGGQQPTTTPIVTAGNRAAPPPLPKPTHRAPTAKAIYDFNATEANELSFKAGDQIKILEQQGNWWKGEINGRTGILPSNYVTMM